jgi:hypothetical protein
MQPGVILNSQSSEENLLLTCQNFIVFLFHILLYRNTVVPDDLSPKQQQTDNEEVERDVKLPFPRKHAWRSPDSPLSSPNPRKVIPPIEAPSVLSEQTSPPGETHRSHRTSELSSEWYAVMNLQYSYLLDIHP